MRVFADAADDSANGNTNASSPDRVALYMGAAIFGGVGVCRADPYRSY